MMEGTTTPLAQELLLAVYDLRKSRVEQRLERELSGWGNGARIECLDEHHVALIVRPGGALRLLA